MVLCLYQLPLAAQWQRPLIDSLQALLANGQCASAECIAVFNELGWQYRRVNLDSGLHYLSQARTLLEGRPYDTLRYQHDYNRGTLLRYQGDYPASIAYLEACLAFAQGSGDTFREANSNYALAISRLENQEYALALQHVQRAHAIFQDLGLVDRELGSLNVMATVLKECHNYTEAERIYQKAIGIAEKLNNEYQLEPLYNNLANNYSIQQKPELALTYYRKALSINERLVDNSGIAIAKGNIANVLFDLGRYAEAKDYLEAAINLRAAMGVEEDLVGYRGRLGALNIYLGQSKLGLQQLEDNLAIARAKGYKNEERAILDHLVKSTRENGLYQVSALYAQEYINYLNKWHSEVLAERIDELNAKYQKAEQDQKIAMLSTINELQHARLSRQCLLLYGGGLVLLIFAGLLFAIYRLYRQLNRRNDALQQALSEKETLLKEIHHRVKNNLQVISSLLNLQAFTVKDQAAQAALREGRARVQSMSLIHQSLYRKDNLTGVNVKEYLQQLCESLLATYQLRRQHIQLRTDIAPITLDVDSIVPLGLIINELLTNIFKYAFPQEQQGRIDIRIVENEQGLELLVCDDGVGIANPADLLAGNSFGYQLIQAFQHKLNADLEVKSEDGTQVRLLIRNYQKAA